MKQNRQEAMKAMAKEDLKRMRVYEMLGQKGCNAPDVWRNHYSSQYRGVFGVEARRSGQLRRIFEQSAQYGNRNFDEAIDEANSIPDRFPATPHTVVFESLDERIAQEMLQNIEEQETLALEWEAAQRTAEKTGFPRDWEQAGGLAMQYIDIVHIDPASRDYWKNLYTEFLEWKKRNSQVQKRPDNSPFL
jgi:hypothetical protein